MCAHEHISDELKHFQIVFENNGYNKQAIKRNIHLPYEENLREKGY